MPIMDTTDFGDQKDIRQRGAPVFRMVSYTLHPFSGLRTAAPHSIMELAWIAENFGRMLLGPSTRAFFNLVILQSCGFGRATLTVSDAQEITVQYRRLLDMNVGAWDAVGRLRRLPVEGL